MNPDTFDRALNFASRHHWDQRRKGTDIPYIAHLLHVAAYVLEAGGGEDAVVAALLHDAIEDAPAGDAERVRRDISGHFGTRVLFIVERLTDADVQPKPPWAARKRAYLAHLRDETDGDVLLVSAADKLHNVSAITRDLKNGQRVWERFKGKRRGTLWYYHELNEIFKSKACALSDDLNAAWESLFEAANVPHVSPDPQRIAFVLDDDGEQDIEVTALGLGEYRLEERMALMSLDIDDEDGIGYGSTIIGDELADGRVRFHDVVPDITLYTISVGLPRGGTDNPDLQDLATRITQVGGNWEVVFGGIASAYVPKKAGLDLRVELRNLNEQRRDDVNASE